MLLLLAIFALIIYILYDQLIGKRLSYPPGPTPIPYLGHMKSIMSPDLANIVKKWKQDYGNVFTIWIANSPAIIIADSDMQKEYMKLDALQGRIESPLVDIVYGGYNGIVITEGETWKEQRRFSLHVLRDLGFGKSVMEDIIHRETGVLVQKIKDDYHREINNKSAVVTNVRELVQECVINIISNICFGCGFAPDDQTPNKLADLMRRHIENQMSPKVALLGLMPSLQYVPIFEHFGADLFKEVNRVFGGLVQTKMNEATLKLDESSDSTSLVEAYVREIKRRKTEGQMGTFSPVQLKYSVIDIFAAGFETTATTILFGIIRLIHEQQVQHRIYEDIEEITGGERELCLGDRPNLPNLHAFICEVQRIANITPIAVPHKTTEDIEIGGYEIPSKTVVIYPTIAIHMDDHIFPEPEKFDISRFTGPEKNEKIEMMRAFGLGKRQCMGETLARAELFLILGYLIHNFKILPEDKNNMPSLQYNKSRPFSPVEFNCTFIGRC